MSPSNAAALQLRQQIFWSIDNDFLDNANFLAGRLLALEPRSSDSTHLLALTYCRLGRFKAAYDFSQKYGANGRHLGCAYVFAQASLQLGGYTDGIAALEKARGLWSGKSNANKHTETTRRHLPDAAAVYTLMGKLWQAHGDMRKAGDCYVEAHKGNPFVWDAFEGLCKVGADLNVPLMFRSPSGTTTGSGAAPSGVTEIYTDDIPQAAQPLAPQNNFNPQVFTPSADPFNSSRDGSELVTHFVLPNAKSRSALRNGVKGSASEWDTPVSGKEEDTTMGGVAVENDVFGTQPPPAPPRRTRPGLPFDASERPYAPTSQAQSGSESHDDMQTRPSAGGYKRNISGHASQASAANDPAAPPRRSNRLFGQGTTARTTRSNTEANAGVPRTERDTRPSKSATGTKGRVGSTVGRVVSGNRKMLPPDRNEKEKERERRAPSRTSERTTVAHPTAPTAQKPSAPPSSANTQADQQALAALLDNFRELAVGCYATARFDCPLAIRTFRSLPSAQRETPWVLAQLGKAQYEAGDFRAAEECFARVLKLQPSRIEDMEVYSTVLWHLKKETSLAFLCHLLRDQDFHAPQTWVAVGNAFSLAREHDQAIAAFKRATQIDEKFAYAWTLMGHEYIANDEFDAALASFRKAVSVDRRGYGGWYGLGKSYEKMGKLEESERHYRIAAAINPSNATLMVCIGVVLERLRNKKAALANYTRALELSPTSALARFKKARVLMHLRYYSEALEELEILRDQAPDEANVWFLLGKCYKGLGGKGEALRAFTTALNLDVKAAPFIKEAMEALDDDDDDEEEDSDDD